MDIRFPEGCMMIKGPYPFALGVALLLTLGANARAQTTPDLLKTINAVGKEGAGNAEATKAETHHAAGAAAAALKEYQAALAASLDVEQIKRIAKKVKELGGAEVDLTRRLGFLTQWQVIGPFDNSAGAGFHKAFAPEKGV